MVAESSTPLKVRRVGAGGIDIGAEKKAVAHAAAASRQGGAPRRFVGLRPRVRVCDLFQVLVHEPGSALDGVAGRQVVGEGPDRGGAEIEAAAHAGVDHQLRGALEFA
jgi:hypothetical protein